MSKKHQILVFCWSLLFPNFRRMVNAVLEEEMKDIHAFSQKTLTPEQWEKQKWQGETTTDIQLCLHHHEGPVLIAPKRRSKPASAGKFSCRRFFNPLRRIQCTFYLTQRRLWRDTSLHSSRFFLSQLAANLKGKMSVGRANNFVKWEFSSGGKRKGLFAWLLVEKVRNSAFGTEETCWTKMWNIERTDVTFLGEPNEIQQDVTELLGQMFLVFFAPVYKQNKLVTRQMLLCFLARCILTLKIEQWWISKEKSKKKKKKKKRREKTPLSPASTSPFHWLKSEIVSILFLIS